jgi:hypothetical protein
MVAVMMMETREVEAVEVEPENQVPVQTEMIMMKTAEQMETIHSHVFSLWKQMI